MCVFNVRLQCASSRCVLKVCPQGVSSRCVLIMRPQCVSSKCVLNVCPQGASIRCVLNVRFQCTSSVCVQEKTPVKEIAIENFLSFDNISSILDQYEAFKIRCKSDLHIDVQDNCARSFCKIIVHNNCAR